MNEHKWYLYSLLSGICTPYYSKSSFLHFTATSASLTVKNFSLLFHASSSSSHTESCIYQIQMRIGHRNLNKLKHTTNQPLNCKTVAYWRSSQSFSSIRLILDPTRCLESFILRPKSSISLLETQNLSHTCLVFMLLFIYGFSKTRDQSFFKKSLSHELPIWLQCELSKLYQCHIE